MFRFKEFTIRQDKCAMKVGTDSVLLGAWAGNSGANLILDVGTGSGVLALMMAQRNLNAFIDAVDIDNGAVEQAVENFSTSKFAERINVFKCDFRNLCEAICVNRYEHIITNPPFYENDTISPDHQRAIARNTVSLPFDILVEGVSKILSNRGLFSIVVPASAVYSIVVKAAQHELFLCRRTDVRYTKSSPIKRVLLEFTKKHICETLRDSLVLHNDDGTMTAEYTQLVSAYYL